MDKRFVNTYVKYTAKKPVLFFTLIFVGVFLISFLSLSTKTGVIVSCGGMVDNHAVIVSGEIYSCTGFIYAYNDKNDAVYVLEINETVHEDGQTVFLLKDINEFISDMNQKEIKVDIPVREITIFERVFLKVGKING